MGNEKRKTQNEKPRIHFDQWVEHEQTSMRSHGIYLEPQQMVYALIDTMEAEIKSGMQVEPITVITLQNMLTYWSCGRQTFNLGPNLVEMFRQTDLSNVMKTDLRLPYNCFFITLPRNTIKIWGGNRTKWHDGQGIYVRQGSMFPGEPPGDIKIAVMGEPNENSTDFNDNAVTWVCLDSLEIESHGSIEKALEAQLQRTPAYAPWRDSFDFESMHQYSADGSVATKNKMNVMRDLIKGETLDERLKQWGNRTPHTEQNTPEQIAELEVSQKQVIIDIVRIAVNLILYLDSKKREVKIDSVTEKRLSKRAFLSEGLDKMSPSKKEKAISKFTKLPLSKVFNVAPSMESVRISKSHHWVRGHWRMQAVGKKWSERRKTWIMPYQKGLSDPQAKPQGARIYLAEDE